MATAFKLAGSTNRSKIVLLEKERSVGLHQSTHNSGVLHAGLYYKPGSLKARLAVSGIREMVDFCEKHGVAHEICGKLVVATSDLEVTRLRELHRRGTDNGLRNLRWLDGPGLHAIEPHAAGVAALHVPEEGIVDYAAVCLALRQEIERAGVNVCVNSCVTTLRYVGSEWIIGTPRNTHVADFIVNCAGLYCDRVSELGGEKRTTRIVPFRGEYFKLRTGVNLVRNLIYPVPDPVFPFLGVHFTRLIHGGVEAGPNAVLALHREGYRKTDFSLRDAFDALSFPGLWRFLGAHQSMCVEEVQRSLSKRLFTRSLQKLVPGLQESDLEPGGAGVRAQGMSRNGTLVQDFSLVERPNCLHLLNAPSPAATASLAIGEYVATRVMHTLNQ